MATKVANPKSLAELIALAKSIRAQPTADPAFVKRHGKPGAVPVGEGQRYVDMILNPQEATTTLPSRSVGNASKPAPATASKPAPATASKPAPATASKPAPATASKPAPATASKPAPATASKPTPTGTARAPPPQVGNARAPPPQTGTARAPPPVNTTSTAGTKKGAPAPGRR